MVQVVSVVVPPRSARPPPSPAVFPLKLTFVSVVVPPLLKQAAAVAGGLAAGDGQSRDRRRGVVDVEHRALAAAAHRQEAGSWTGDRGGGRVGELERTPGQRDRVRRDLNTLFEKSIVLAPARRIGLADRPPQGADGAVVERAGDRERGQKRAALERHHDRQSRRRERPSLPSAARALDVRRIADRCAAFDRGAIDDTILRSIFAALRIMVLLPRDAESLVENDVCHGLTIPRDAHLPFEPARPRRASRRFGARSAVGTSASTASGTANEFTVNPSWP